MKFKIGNRVRYKDAGDHHFGFATIVKLYPSEHLFSKIIVTVYWDSDAMTIEYITDLELIMDPNDLLKEIL